ncbi:hypothetical protein V6N13_054813 [Hibiscus sabdariffa]
MYISRHVTFNEHIFPCATSSCTHDQFKQVPSSTSVPSFPSHLASGTSSLPATIEESATTSPILPTDAETCTPSNLRSATPINASHTEAHTDVTFPEVHSDTVLPATHTDTIFPEDNTDATTPADNADHVDPVTSMDPPTVFAEPPATTMPCNLDRLWLSSMRYKLMAHGI